MSPGTHKEPEVGPPSSTPGRLPAVDVLRGIAILGTLATNIWLFTSGLASSEAAGDVPWLLSTSQLLSNGKFLGLLTIMFGIGLEIQRQAALRGGRPWPGTYPVRAGLLFLDGAVNYVLVVEFDVLRAYAVTGFVVAFLLLTSDRVQLWVAAVFVTLHLALTFRAGGLGGSSGLDRGSGSRDLLGDEGAPPVRDAMPLTWSDDGGYWDDVRSRLATLMDLPALASELSQIVIMGVAMFLLGARTYRAGVFEPTGRALRRWLMCLGGVSLLVELALLSPFTTVDLGRAIIVARYGTAPVVAFGLLALVAELYQHRPVGRTGRLLAGVGVTALTCYILQNVVGVILSHTLVGAVDLSSVQSYYATWALFVVISGLLVVFANLWLRRFRRGPVELLWHWSYRRITRS